MWLEREAYQALPTCNVTHGSASHSKCMRASRFVLSAYVHVAVAMIPNVGMQER